MDSRWQATLGYSARADILLTRDDGTRRIWIEFEVSRADPVANHAKFATSHLFEPQPKTDAFVAMVSSHVTRGRRNLAANTILLMRRIGMRAFQTVLLPSISPADIKRLNHLSIAELLTKSIDTDSEIARAMLISSVLSINHQRIRDSLRWRPIRRFLQRSAMERRAGYGSRTRIMGQANNQVFRLR